MHKISQIYQDKGMGVFFVIISQDKHLWFVHFSECYASIKKFKCNSDKSSFEELFLVEVTCFASFLTPLPELNVSVF